MMYTGSHDLCRLWCMPYAVVGPFAVSWVPPRFQGRQVTELSADLRSSFPGSRALQRNGCQRNGASLS